MMRAARTVLLLSLALWTGGLATISFVVAPTAFKVSSNRRDAGPMVGAVLRGFNRIEVACAALALGAAGVLFAKRPEGTRRGLLSLTLVFVMGAIALSLMLWIYPDAAMARARFLMPATRAPCGLAWVPAATRWWRCTMLWNVSWPHSAIAKKAGGFGRT